MHPQEEVASTAPSSLPDAMVLEDATCPLDHSATWEDIWDSLNEQQWALLPVICGRVSGYRCFPSPTQDTPNKGQDPRSNTVG